MTLLEALCLGIVQGITEFLPISSSGHLVVFQSLLGFEEPLMAFDVLLHSATLLAVCVYFAPRLRAMFSDLICFFQRKIRLSESPNMRLAGWILLAMVPTGLVAILFKDALEGFFENPRGVAVAWLVMGTLLIASMRFKSGERNLEQLKLRDALWIGLVQGISVIPGISRSGSTILAGMSLGLMKSAAAAFSFLLSIPAVTAASILELKDGLQGGIGFLAAGTGFVAAFVSGFFAICFLMRLLEKGKFYIFGIYCLLAGSVTLALSYLHKI